MAKMLRLGIDLGGTNIAAGLVDADFRVIEKVSIKTPRNVSGEQLAQAIVQAGRSVLEKANVAVQQLANIGLGAPGTVNKNTGMIERANNLNLRMFPMREILTKALGKTVYLENDANAAAYGEFIAGGAKGTDSAVVLTLGTGVGGGIIIDRKVYSGFNFSGAELGHMVIEASGRPCNCGRQGCFETYCSATALIQSTKEKMRTCKDSILWQLCNGDLDRVNGKTAFDAAKSGDQAGAEVVAQFQYYLGVGIANIVNIFAPQVVCIGGGLSNQGDYLLDPVRAFVAQQTYGRYAKAQPKIVQATLGNDAGIVGAAVTND